MNDIWKIELTGPDEQRIEIDLENCSIDAIRPVVHNEERNRLEPSPFTFYSITGVAHKTVVS